MHRRPLGCTLKDKQIEYDYCVYTPHRNTQQYPANGIRETVSLSLYHNQFMVYIRHTNTNNKSQPHHRTGRASAVIAIAMLSRA